MVDGRLGVNVALNRPSYLSTEYLPAWAADKGNDGDKSNCDVFLPSPSLAHTLPELNPWYGIDLGVSLHVAGVKLTNRYDSKLFSFYRASVTQLRLSACSRLAERESATVSGRAQRGDWPPACTVRAQ